MWDWRQWFETQKPKCVGIVKAVSLSSIAEEDWAASCINFMYIWSSVNHYLCKGLSHLRTPEGAKGAVCKERNSTEISKTKTKKPPPL